MGSGYLAPSLGIVVGSPNHHPAVQPSAIPVAIVGSDDIKSTAVQKELRPYLSLDIGRPLPGSSPIGRSVSKTV